MCYEVRRTEACVDQWAHHALVNEGACIGAGETQDSFTVLTCTCHGSVSGVSAGMETASMAVCEWRKQALAQ